MAGYLADVRKAKNYAEFMNIVMKNDIKAKLTLRII